MANVNKIILIGNLTADPDMRFTVDGAAVTKYRLAVDRPRRSDGAESGVDFIPVVCFGKLAEISGEYLKKGRQVLVEGRIQVRSYTTAEGQAKWTTEVVASNMNLLDKKAQKEEEIEGPGFPGAQLPEEEIGGSDEVYDDIPF